jgi:hypothetical protein
MWMSAQELTLSYERPMRLASRYQTFKATVYAINTLLVHERNLYTGRNSRSFLLNGQKKGRIEEGPARGVSRSKPEFS